MSADTLIAMHHAVPIGFEDHKHVVNFHRYLFSQNRSHPATKQTARNLVIEAHGGKQKPYYNTDPKTNFAACAARLDKEANLSGRWVNDLSYFAFLLPVSGGWISNFMSGTLGTRGEGLDFHDGNAAGLCLEIGFSGNQERFQAQVTRMLQSGDEVIAYQSAPQTVCFEAEKKLFGHLRAAHPGKPVLGVIHNDQETPCHIHRVLVKP